MAAGPFLLRLFPLGDRPDRGPFAPIIRRYAWATPVVVVLGTAASLLEGLGIGMLIPMIAAMVKDMGPAATPGPVRQLSALTEALPFENRVVAIGVVVVGMIALKCVIQIANGALIGRIESKVSHDTRIALARKLLEADFSFYLKEEPARLTRILTTDAWYGLETVRCGFAAMAAATAACVTALLLVWIDWRLTLIVAVGVLVIRFVQTAIERHVGRLGDQIVMINERLYGKMLIILGAVRPIRLFQQERREERRFAAESDAIRRNIDRSGFWATASSPLVELLMASLFVALLVIASGFGWALPTVSVFLLLLYRMQPHINMIATSRLRASAVRGSLQEVEWLLSVKTGPASDINAAPREAFSLEAPIRFEGVSYAYPNGAEGLHDVSFTLRPGVATALIGRSGAGKSTVVNLLCRLLEPSQGRILLGELPSGEISRADWLQRIAMAGQDIELITGTVAENLAYGKPGAARSELVEVARVVHADAFIEALPQGYDTMVGEGGLTLSGGQRQRIGLARALLRRPDLLILDEATSAVDAISETEIMRLLGEKAWFRSVLVISHRRSTLMACEDGIVLAGGRVREAGPLSSLAYFHEMMGG